MIDVLTGFIEELRAAGLPISVDQTIDACEAVRQVPIERRPAFRAALSSTLVKSQDHLPIFDTAFEVFFALAPAGVPGDGDGEPPDLAGAGDDAAPGAPAGPAEGVLVEPEAVRALVLEALSAGEHPLLVQAARLSVAAFAGIEPGRPVGVSYYVHKTMRGIDLEGLLALLIARRTDGAIPGPLGAAVLEEEYRSRGRELRDLVEAEIRRALVAERGAKAVAASLRKTPIDGIDFMHASREELAAISRAIYPLARVLAARLSRRRRHQRLGALDFRATMRESLSSGGVPLDPRFRRKHPARPEIFVLADVSGSVASFARFTVHLVYAIQAQFSKVRSAVFIDGVDEVTRIFRRASSVAEAFETVAREADVVGADGHSDYGRVLVAFAERYGHEITTRTNLLVLGDARNNYHAANAEVLEHLAKRARRVLWLNPEPRAYWGSGDSIIGEYARYCDGVFECRNLAQLSAFVDRLD